MARDWPGMAVGMLGVGVVVFIATPITSAARELPYASVMAGATWIAVVLSLAGLAEARRRREALVGGLFLTLVASCGCAGLATLSLLGDWSTVSHG